MVAADEVAILTAAQRTAMLTSFVLIIVGMVVAPRYANMWKNNNPDGVRRLARISTRAMVVMVLPVSLIMFLLPEHVMRVFGEGFDQGARYLTILALGQLVNVAVGSVGFLLNMTGHDQDLRNVTLVVGVISIILAYVLASHYSATGAAIATATGVAMQNIAAMYFVRKRLGFWPGF
jgi:O-antigen/teichoic acid export membrane protein